MYNRAKTLSTRKNVKENLPKVPIQGQKTYREGPDGFNQERASVKKGKS
jgi:hypothetical protein